MAKRYHRKFMTTNRHLVKFRQMMGELVYVYYLSSMAHMISHVHILHTNKKIYIWYTISLQSVNWSHYYISTFSDISRKDLPRQFRDVYISSSLQWRHNEHDGVPNHQPQDCLLNRLSNRRSKRTSWSASLAFLWGIHGGPLNSPH